MTVSDDLSSEEKNKKRVNDNKDEDDFENSNNKKNKCDNEEDNGERNDEEYDEVWQAASSAWKHYRNYLDSCPEDENDSGNTGGDIDELQELIEILTPFVSKPDMTTSIFDDIANDKVQVLTKDMVVDSYCTIESLLPVLMSVAFSNIGSHAVTESLVPCKDDNKFDYIDESDSPDQYLEKSLAYFKGNASSLSILANYKRISSSISRNRSPAKVHVDPHVICRMYEMASDNAKAIREGALVLLESEDDEMINDACKEWIELLFLNGIVSSEYTLFDDEEDDSEKDEKNNKEKQKHTSLTISNTDKEEKETDERVSATKIDEISNTELVIDEEMERMEGEEMEGGDGRFSFSQVEATSSFMASLIHSTLGNHSKALQYLKKFKITHRIHPNLWTAAYTKNFDSNDQNKNKERKCDSLLFVPKSFRSFSAINNNHDNTKSIIEGILPKELYQQLCDIFAPNANYWKESDYNNRGYYSYFHDIDEKNKTQPNNIIEDVVIHHLLPRVQAEISSLSSNQTENGEKDEIVGFEWWTHTRPMAANLGHQLHFDTDEALLAQDGQQITHPIVSSVLYLTTSDDLDDDSISGPTIVFHQDPSSNHIATQAWISRAIPNSFMIFPGNALHGVLPCRYSNKNHSNNSKHRLSFMVGFWTRRVPEKMKERHLYGPCGPLPPLSDEHSWVKQISKGYDTNNTSKQQHSVTTSARKLEKVKSVSLPTVSPCWETIEYKSDKDDYDDEVEEEDVLELPSGLDHRFFVHNAPFCFRDSLFEKQNNF